MEAKKKRDYLKVLDVVAGGAGAYMCAAAAALDAGTPVQMGAIAYIAALLGGVTFFMSSTYLRGMVSERVGPGTPGVIASVSVPIVLAIACIVAVGVFASSRANADSVQMPVAQPTAVIAMATSQPANGLRNEDLNAQLVLGWAEYFSSNYTTLAKKKCVANGGSEEICQSVFIAVNHVLTPIDGRNVAIISFSANSQGRVVSKGARIMSVMGDQVVSVSCVRESDERVDISESPCVNEIERTLGLAISKDVARLVQ